MLKKSYEFFIVFIKSMIDEKIALAWSILLPLLLFFSINYSWFHAKPDVSKAVYYYASFWAFSAVLVVFNGIGLRLTDFRELGILKSFVFICGSKVPIIVGLLLSQIVFGLVSLALFTVVISIVFDYPIFLLFFTATCTYLVVLLPLFMLSLSIASLSVRASSAYTLVNMLIFPATYLAIYRGESTDFFTTILYYLNPVEYVFRFSVFTYDALTNNLHLNSNHLFLLVISIVYIAIGVIAWSKIKIASTVRRT
ncbi:ABC transporter [Brevibacillus agri]|uniref:ABC transporter n=1 Tax=Brevibacillus agri TaxID=51101 RepID=UPI001C8EF010|nr:ABC transporter [Brevibacillus agri]MBY0050830.1 ABC transporter permease [Brevibacillus agri]